MSGVVAALERADALIYRADRLLVVAGLATMGSVVFIDVMNRTVGGASVTFQGAWIGGAIGVGVLGSLARKPKGNLAIGGAIGGAVGGLTLGLPVLFPSGLAWSQPLALAITLWLGMAGACLAAHDRRHLAMDIGSKLLPASIAPYALAFGLLVTALFCLMLGGLGARSVLQHYDLWSATEGHGATLSGTDIPKWTAAAAIPYGMAVLAFRFLLEAWKVATGKLAIGGDDTLHQLGIQEET